MPALPWLHPARLLAAALSLLALWPGQTTALASTAPTPPQPGCTVFYGFDGQTALGGNNEDFNNPLTLVWFIPASPGRFGRVYFGYDDYIPQGGMNDQGVFFDALALPYKAMPEASQRPHFPDGDLAFFDEILATSANIQDVIDTSSRWYRVSGEYAQYLYGDRFGDAVIIDGDTVLPKQGPFQLATNFRLVDNPNPPYPEERFETLTRMLTDSDKYSVELFRQALAAAHAEGDYPTVYSQIYELQTGRIHVYQYHDFEHEVVLNLADELAKGYHVATLASLFPRSDALERWAVQRRLQWTAAYRERINSQIDPDSQSWMTGDYLLQAEAEAEPVTIYLEDHQLYLQRPNQLPVELYPTDADAVFHHYYNGMDLTLTFQRTGQGQASGAQGAFSFEPYGINLPYQLTRVGATPDAGSSVVIPIASVGLGLSGLGVVSLIVILRRRRRVVPVS